ncbi:MAG: hypothetical protein AB7O68_16825 [Pirellulales bacterium]
MRTLTLSDGSKVTLKDKYTHKMAKAFAAFAYRSVVYEPDDLGEMQVTRKVPKNDIDAAYEAVIALLVERVEKAGAEQPFSQAWLDELPPQDYDLLEAEAIAIKGEKNGGAEKKGGRSG